MKGKSDYVEKVKEKLEEFKFKSPEHAKDPKLVEKKMKEVEKVEKKEDKKEEKKDKKATIVAKVMKKLANSSKE